MHLELISRGTNSRMWGRGEELICRRGSYICVGQFYPGVNLVWEVLFHVLHRHTVLAEQCRVKEGVRFCLVLEALSLFRC